MSTQPQWNTLKEGTILKTENVRVRFIKSTNESDFTGQIVEILNKSYKGYIGEICTNFNKGYEWEIESNIVGGEVGLTESNTTPTEPHSQNYESLYRDKLSEIQKLQESNKRLKEVIRLLTKEI